VESLLLVILMLMLVVVVVDLGKGLGSVRVCRVFHPPTTRLQNFSIILPFCDVAMHIL